MMPWKWNIGSLNVAVNGGFKNPRSAENLRGMMPFFFNQLDFIGNQAIIEKVAAGIVKSVQKGEEKFDQTFGGWIPASNEFGVVPLRPQILGKADGRWIWTDSASSSLDWSADDSFIATHTLDDDELVYIYGYFNLEPTPNIVELFIQPGSNKLPIWNMEQFRASDKSYTIFPEGIIIEPRSSITILAATRSLTAQVTEEAGLMGYFFAPLAKLITKEP
jgi:hypothetical protein